MFYYDIELQNPFRSYNKYVHDSFVPFYDLKSKKCEKIMVRIKKINKQRALLL